MFANIVFFTIKIYIYDGQTKYLSVFFYYFENIINEYKTYWICFGHLNHLSKDVHTCLHHQKHITYNIQAHGLKGKPGGHGSLSQDTLV